MAKKKVNQPGRNHVKGFGYYCNAPRGTTKSVIV